MTEHDPAPADPASPLGAGVIALDGPSGTGKSTVARRLAQRLGARYLDTGAMYRAATVAVLDAGVDPSDADAVAKVVADSVIEIGTDPAGYAVRLGGVDVSERIRDDATTAAVSPVSAVASVRTKLVAQQRDLIGGGGIVVEGRDIASVVWPHARLKVFLTADAATRAQRRADQTGASDVAGVESTLQRRDAFDSSRAASPLVRTDDAVEVDTSALSIDEVVSTIVGLLDGHDD